MFNNYLFGKDDWEKGVLYLVTILIIYYLFQLGRKKVKFSYRVIVGMILGIAVGFFFGGYQTPITNGKDTTMQTIVTTIRPIGLLYLRLIQMVIMPLILTAIIKSFTSLESTDKLKKIGVKTLFWLLSTTMVATIIGLIFAGIFGLGNDFGGINGNASTIIKPIENVILEFFPNNIFAALMGNVAIPVVIFAIFISVAFMIESKRNEQRVKPFIEFNNSLNQLMTRITKMVITLTPYAVFSFMAYAIARNEMSVLKGLGIYILVIYGAMLVHFIFVQMGLLAVHKISPIKFIKNFSQAMTMAFVTQSSYGTMPVSIRVLEDNVGVSSRVANFVAPIGANVGMNACGGIFPAMVAVITANAMGMNLSGFDYILIVIVTTISSIGIAGVPGIATIAATVTLSAIGLPIEGILLVAAVEPLVDMGRTMVNVVGAGVAATLVAKSEKELDMDIFNAEVPKDVQLQA